MGTFMYIRVNLGLVHTLWCVEVCIYQFENNTFQSLMDTLYYKLVLIIIFMEYYSFKIKNFILLLLQKSVLKTFFISKDQKWNILQGNETYIS